MNDKIEKHFPFQVGLRWVKGQTAIISSDEVEGSIQVEAPPVFGGEGMPWTPEHLFLGSISSCFMTTYMAFARKLKFEVSNFSCEVKGEIRLVEGKLIFTKVDLFPKITISSSELREKADLALDKTKKYCIISNSIQPGLTSYHSEVIVNEQPGIITEMNMNKSA